MAASKPGPAKMPTRLKLATGEQRPSRVNRNEPLPQVSAAPPEVPKWLTRKIARATWRRLAPKLWERGVLTEWDLETFAVLCNLIAINREAEEQIGADLVIENELETRIGTVYTKRVSNHAWPIYRDTTNQIRQLAAQFGLTPSGRAGIELEAKEDPDGRIAEILGGAR